MAKEIKEALEPRGKESERYKNQNKAIGKEANRRFKR